MPNANRMINRIPTRMETITLIIPSHIPICAIVLPAGEAKPASISFNSFFPIIQAGIPVRIPHPKTQAAIPKISAQIALVLDLSLCIPPDGGGGGVVGPPGGGGGGGAPNSS